MESSSTCTSGEASPDVRPIICESLLDLSDWGDLLGDQSSKASSAEDISDECAKEALSDHPPNSDIDFRTKSSRGDDSINSTEVKSHGTAVRARTKNRHSWPEVSVKLGQDVTYNSFPHEHFSFAFKEVFFQAAKWSEDDEDEDLPEPPSSTKAEKTSHKQSKKAARARKAEKHASAVEGRNSPDSRKNQTNAKSNRQTDGKRVEKVGVGVSLSSQSKATPTITLMRSPTVVPKIITPGVSILPRVTHPAVAEKAGGAAVASTKRTINAAQSAIPGPVDGRSTPSQACVGADLPPTPPNEPVLLQPLLRAAAGATTPRVPAAIPRHCLQVILPSTAPAAPATPATQPGIQFAASPTIHILTPQILTPPHTTIDRPVASISPLRKPPADPPPADPCKKPTNDPVKKSDVSRESPSQADSSGGKPPSAKKDIDVMNKCDDKEEEIVIVDEEKAEANEKKLCIQPEDCQSSLAEDVQDALSPLKRKAPSSPCSTLLKIKCEKIDAVVRINKTSEDLYRAEKGPEKSSVEDGRDSSSAAEQGCFFSVVEKALRLGVCPCGRANAYDAMIACDSPSCEAEWYHFSCVGVTKVPKDEWFCPFCSKEAAAQLRKKKEQQQEQRRKKALRRKKRAAREEEEEEEGKRRRKTKKNVLEEEGLCPCGQPNSWDRMIACDGKECSVEWYHFKCVDVQSAPDTEWLCILCRDSGKEASSSPYVRRRRRYRPIKYSIYDDMADFSSSNDTEGHEEKDWPEPGKDSDSSDEGSNSSDAENFGEEYGRKRRSRGAKERMRQRGSGDGSKEEEGGSSSDEELNRSKRSRRKRHKKVDLDFEDGAQFDVESDNADRDMCAVMRLPGGRRPTKRTEKASSSSEEEEGTEDVESSSVSSKQTMPKDSSASSKEDGTMSGPVSSPADGGGRFLIQQCASCSQEFVTPPPDHAASSSPKQTPSDPVHCPLCTSKAAKQGPKSSVPGDTAINSAHKKPPTPEGAAPAGDASSGAPRATRFHEIVSCKVCGMGYRTRVSLLIHMKAKHQGHLTNFECGPCDKLFISQDEYAMHLAAVHHV